jgi:hypothetical protein
MYCIADFRIYSVPSIPETVEPDLLAGGLRGQTKLNDSLRRLSWQDFKKTDGDMYHPLISALLPDVP